jgi:hypothetical protein
MAGGHASVPGLISPRTHGGYSFRVIMVLRNQFFAIQFIPFVHLFLNMAFFDCRTEYVFQKNDTRPFLTPDAVCCGFALGSALRVCLQRTIAYRCMSV